MTRTLTRLTLERVAQMATDPTSTPALRDFHQNQLEDLRKRYKQQQQPKTESVFSRFLERLEK